MGVRIGPDARHNTSRNVDPVGGGVHASRPTDSGWAIKTVAGLFCDDYAPNWIPPPVGLLLLSWHLLLSGRWIHRLVGCDTQQVALSAALRGDVARIVAGEG